MPEKRCPICNKALNEDRTAFPFCSARCKQIDLGNWLDGRYTFPDPRAPLTDDEDDERQ